MGDKNVEPQRKNNNSTDLELKHNLCLLRLKLVKVFLNVYSLNLSNVFSILILNIY